MTPKVTVLVWGGFRAVETRGGGAQMYGPTVLVVMGNCGCCDHKELYLS